MRGARLIVLAAALMPGLALAETSAPVQAPAPAMDASAFDAATLGRTFDTFDSIAGLYGIETFHPGRRVTWADSEACVEGSWEQQGELICFHYQNRPQGPICWSYHPDGSRILGFHQGDQSSVPIFLEDLGREAVSCSGWLGS